MGSITPNPNKRSYLLPPGCKDLIDVLNGPPAKLSLAPNVRVNGQIRAAEVRVVGEDGRLVWMIDGYSATSMYPISQSITIENTGAVRYLHNTVKATIDGPDPHRHVPSSAGCSSISASASPGTSGARNG